MEEVPGVLVGKGDSAKYLRLRLANRHGLIAGATGTGKTVTLQEMAEGFSAAGVPVFCADIKGDLSGISQPGSGKPELAARAAELGVAHYAPAAMPVIFWDVFGVQGHPIRATVAEMGPVLLTRMLELNDTQEGVLTIAFALADKEGLLLLDFKDLRAILNHVGERAGELTTAYGNVSKASIGTIQRRLLALEQMGGAAFFGEPALALSDLMLSAPDGRGFVNVLAADKLIQTPRLYATFLLWLLSEMFEQMPEVGDLDRPKLVFFFDEAHLLFKDTPKSLVEKIEQVVRLIRSKGVGIYFVTQNPVDLPSTVLGQLGNRVQHALRAFSPVEQKSVKAAAATFRANPNLNTETVITELKVGEALVSLLEADGTPAMVDRAKICPPRSRIGAITLEERKAVMAASPLVGKYETEIDRHSAYERLSERAVTPVAASVPAMRGSVPATPVAARSSAAPARATGPARAAGPTRSVKAPPSSGDLLTNMLLGDGRRQGLVESVAKSVFRGAGSQVGTRIGRSVMRGVLGSLLK
jgi:DNA helicase HerA-like ATPase